MEVLRFRLSGETAFFKKPDVNTYYYFTYSNIHKIALLGIFGAILGYKGYNHQQHDKNAIYPEFYKELKDIKIGIVPKNDKGYIQKKIQVFNNSIGYASQEQGGNLIVKEQWLEEPKWDIYVLIDGEKERELADRIIERKFKYIPYLGKNDHIANITDMKIIKDIRKLENPHRIDSLFIKRHFELQTFEDDVFDMSTEYISIYKYQEMLPVLLEETSNAYEFETFVYTNASLVSKGNPLIYQCDNDVIFFF